MSADLDDLFTALGRHSDALPPAGVADARRRGAARKRSRALAAAAAVLLVLAGTGVVAWQRRHAEPILPATSPARIRGMEPVGEPLRPPAGETWTAPLVAGGYGYAISASPDSRVHAFDLATGAPTWTSEPIASPAGIALSATPTALVVQQQAGLVFLDPRTGARLWELTSAPRDLLQLHTDVLAHFDLDTGTIEAYDVRTGARLWAAAAGDERPVTITGMRTAPDGDEPGFTSAPLAVGTADRVRPFTDDRLIEVTEKGGVRIRDIRTGKVRTTVQTQEARPDYAIGYEGTVYTLWRDGAGSVRISATGTDPGAGPSRVVYREEYPDGPSFADFYPCGAGTVCVYERRPTGASPEIRDTYLLRIDAVGGRVLWEAPARWALEGGTMRVGRAAPAAPTDSIVSTGTVNEAPTTAVFGPGGRLLARAEGAGGIVDDGNVLVLVRDARSGRFAVRAISTIDGRTTDLGTVPEISGRCDWNADYLTCPSGTGLRIWKFRR
ncbi:PQQ-binding-like beta-propeller repeat protein [Actinoplanes sp. NPDC023936]|uniref:outer membrane protein assembly factor BamB family protein n=1 Tax=Actinoplanes sp. NPDC023936 TaxID=3154910 RepID=UPI0033FCA82E